MKQLQKFKSKILTSNVAESMDRANMNISKTPDIKYAGDLWHDASDASTKKRGPIAMTMLMALAATRVLLRKLNFKIIAFVNKQ